MKLSNLILPIALLGGYVYIKNVGETLDIANQFSVQPYDLNFRQVSAGILQTTIFPEIEVTNPTNSSTTLDSVSGTLVMNGTQIATYYVSNITIKPGSNIIKVPCKVSNLGTLSSIIQYFVNGIGKPINLAITGMLNKGAINVKFNEPYNLNVPGQKTDKVSGIFGNNPKGHYGVKDIGGFYHVVYHFANGDYDIISKRYNSADIAMKALNRIRYEAGDNG